MFLRIALFTLIGIGLTAFGGIAWLSLRPTNVSTAAEAAVMTPAKVVVLAAARPLRAGSLLKPEDVSPLEMNAVDVRPGARPDTPQARGEMLGAMIKRSLVPGEVVMPGDLMRPGDHGFLAAVLGAGMRAVSVGVDAVSGTAGLIWPGDNVDLILTMDDNNAAPGHRVSGETVLHSVRVIAIDQQMVQGAAAGGADYQPARTVTLEVTPAQAERVQVAVRLGKLSLVVVSAEDAPTVITSAAPSGAPSGINGGGNTGSAMTGAASSGSASSGPASSGPASSGTTGFGAGQPAPEPASADSSVTWGGDVSAALRQGRSSDSRTIRLFQGSADSKEFHF